MINSILKSTLVSVITVFFTFAVSAQNLTFSVATVTYDGQFSPYNCFVLWITDANGKYIKTINRQSTTYTYYLTNWRINSGAKMTDGQTGATLMNHNELYFDEMVKRIPYAWNCKDFNGLLVPDGEYFVNVEFTENDGDGKYIKYAFTKGGENKTISYPNVGTDPGVYFQNAILKYYAPITSVPLVDQEKAIGVFYNSENRNLNVSYNMSNGNSKLLIMDSKGVLKLTQNLYYSPCKFDLKNLETGVYVVQLINGNNKKYSQKIIIK